MNPTEKLFDVLGPRGRRRSLMFGAGSVVVVGLIVAFVLYRFFVTGQFDAEKWRIFTFPLVQKDILDATLSTLRAFASGAVLSILLGVLLVLGRISESRWVPQIFTVIVEIFRGVPLLVLMMLMYYGLPVIGVRFMNPYWAVVLSLMLYNGAVLSEIFRAGLGSIPKGQAEAGYAIGLSRLQILRMILGPQAARIMLPSIVSQLVVELKDTSLGFMITYPELLYLSKFYGTQIQYGSPIIPAAIVMGSIYVALCLLLSFVAVQTERWSSRDPRGSDARARDKINRLVQGD